MQISQKLEEPFLLSLSSEMETTLDFHLRGEGLNPVEFFSILLYLVNKFKISCQILLVSHWHLIKELQT